LLLDAGKRFGARNSDTEDAPVRGTYKQFIQKHKMIADGRDGKGYIYSFQLCRLNVGSSKVSRTRSTLPVIDEKLIRSSRKVGLLTRILPKFFATGRRVRDMARCLFIPLTHFLKVIFFQMTTVMDIMEDVKMMGWKYLTLASKGIPGCPIFLHSCQSEDGGGTFDSLVDDPNYQDTGWARA
jgi:hypothetical protein